MAAIRGHGRNTWKSMQHPLYLDKKCINYIKILTTYLSDYLPTLCLLISLSIWKINQRALDFLCSYLKRRPRDKGKKPSVFFYSMLSKAKISNLGSFVWLYWIDLTTGIHFLSLSSTISCPQSEDPIFLLFVGSDHFNVCLESLRWIGNKERKKTQES